MRIIKPTDLALNLENFPASSETTTFKKIKLENEFGIFCINRYGLVGEIIEEEGPLKGAAIIEGLELWLEFVQDWSKISSEGLCFLQVVSREMKFKEGLPFFTHISGRSVDEIRLAIMDPVTGFAIDNADLNTTPIFLDKNGAPIKFDDADIQDSFDEKGQYQVISSKSIERDLLLLGMSDSGNIAYKSLLQYDSINMLDFPQTGHREAIKLNGTYFSIDNIDHSIIRFETYVAGLSSLSGDPMVLDGNFYGGISWGYKFHTEDYEKHTPKLLTNPSAGFKNTARKYNDYINDLSTPQKVFINGV